VDETWWLMTPERPSTSSAKMRSVTSPATLKLSEPRPPMTLTTVPARVDCTKKLSSPSRPSTSSRSSLAERPTFRPAPNTPSRVITKASAPSVPSTTTVSKPAPPSILTGALMLYCTTSSPPPPRISVVWVEEEPLPDLSRKARITNSSLPASPESLREA
jgi:hypothetical protein